MTLALVLANVFVFLQSGDQGALERAASWYRSFGLATTELPHLIAELRAQGEEPAAQWLELAEEPERSEVALQLVEREPAIRERVAADPALRGDAQAYADWQRHRAHLHALLDERFTERHLLHYDAPAASELVTHQFLHGSGGHLVGNMVFLVVFGALIEGALGPWLFLGVYLLAGVGGGGASLLRHLGDPGGLLGASGAIAGLSGVLCVAWGLRRIRVFYWFLFVFDYVKVPALLLLPPWLGWELWQLWSAPDAGVAFDAHAGGILSGAVLAFAVRGLGWERRDYLGSDERAERRAAQLAELRQALGRLEFARARPLADALHAARPEDREVRLLRYRAWRERPADPTFHDAARALLLDPHGVGRQASEHVALFDDYVAATQRKPRLAPAELFAIARRWLAAGQLDPAERVLELLARRDAALDGLAASWLELLLARRERADAAAGARVAAAIARHFPGSPQAHKARALTAS